jgi:hypothetical protein
LKFSDVSNTIERLNKNKQLPKLSSILVEKPVHLMGNRKMIKNIVFTLSVMLLVLTGTAQARETLHEFSVDELKKNPDYAAQLSGFSFYFGDQPHPTVQKSYGEYPTNKKTNAFNKSDLVACEWVALSALVQLRDRAVSMGADAVINIESNYKNRRVRSDTHYVCGAGNVVAGVAFVGEIVKLQAGSAAPGSAASSSPPAKSAGGASDIREAQELLTELGYSPGPADGIMGSRTSAALGVFQTSEGLEVTGAVNRATLEALREKTGNNSRPEASASDDVDRATEPEERSGTATATAKTELKSMADPFADTLAVIGKDSEVEILKDGGEWFFVSFNGQKGYVLAEFFSQ